MQNFTKKERLNNKLVINNLFSNGNSIVLDPFYLIWKEEQMHNKSAIKFLISVPKRNIKLATKRNLLKRRINEALRLNKERVYDNFLKPKKALNIVIVYVNKEIQTYSMIEQKINLLLDRLIDRL